MQAVLARTIAKIEHMCYLLGMTRQQLTRLDEALVEFASHLDKRPVADNSRKAYWGDVNLFVRHLTQEQAQAGPPLLKITGEHVRSFLSNEEQRKNANSPKSIERRLTSLKVFFRFLRERGDIALDPADGVPYRPVVDPLPEYLNEDDAARVLQAARDYAAGEKLDTRPLAAITLVLEVGIKKSECLALVRDDIDRSARTIYIRYPKKHLKFKERELLLSLDGMAVIDAHMERYGVSGHLFDCTGRNIEYIFNGKIAPKAGLSVLTFEQLRWTCALRDFRTGVLDDEALQYKYGLSPIGWVEMSAKLERIVKQPLTV
jgi:site-specific recombinase XerD